MRAVVSTHLHSMSGRIQGAESGFLSPTKSTSVIALRARGRNWISRMINTALRIISTYVQNARGLVEYSPIIAVGKGMNDWNIRKLEFNQTMRSLAWRASPRTWW